MSTSEKRREQKKKDKLDRKIKFYLEKALLPIEFYRLLAQPLDIFDYYKKATVSKVEKFLKDFWVVRQIPIDTDDYVADVLKATEGVKGFPGLFLGGNSHIGKTILASYIIYRLIQEHALDFYKGCMMLNVPMFLDKLRPGRDSDTSLLDKALEVDLLVLDDFGAEVLTPWVFERLYLIINERKNSLRPIIYTSNLRFQDLAIALNALDPVAANRIVSRIEGTCTILTVK